MSSIDPGHPAELLEAYALNALEDEEAAEVEAHLRECLQCGQSILGLQRAAASLGQSVRQAPPPSSLLPRLLQSLPSNSSNGSAATNAGTPAGTAGRRFSLATLALPLAAALVLSLFGVSMAMNLHISGRMDRLEQASTAVATQLDQSIADSKRMEQENALLAQRLNQLPADGQELRDTVQQIRAASYLMARPDTQPMVLESPSGTGQSNGVMLVGDGGSRAVLMVSDMASPGLQQPYDVWLVRNGGRVPVGQVSVDATGWGSLTLVPPEPLSQFEWVSLTMKDTSGTSPTAETMVLRSRIPPMDEGK